jgi:hypothetical protein
MIVRSPPLILLANPSQRPPCGRHREQTEADQMEKQLSAFFTLQFTLNGMDLLESLSKMKRLLSAYIPGALRAWLCLRFF